MIEKAIIDYNKYDYLTRIDENTLIMSLTLFYYCFFKSSNPISDVFDITTLYEKEDKNEIILNFLSEVLKNFKEEQLNEIFISRKF